MRKTATLKWTLAGWAMMALGIASAVGLFFDRNGAFNWAWYMGGLLVPLGLVVLVFPPIDKPRPDHGSSDEDKAKPSE